MVLSTWDGKATWEFESIREGEMERGDKVGAMLEGSSLNELGDTSSGLAMRKPPRDWERLKSPSMAGVARVKRVTGLVLVCTGSGVEGMAIDSSNAAVPGNSGW